jgi:hypothetical protein
VGVYTLDLNEIEPSSTDRRLSQSAKASKYSPDQSSISFSSELQERVHVCESQCDLTGFNKKTEALLLAYHWPGNASQWESVTRRRPRQETAACFVNAQPSADTLPH